MSVVSKTSCSHFFGRWSYLGYTHALTPKLWAEFLMLMSVDYIWTYLNTMRDLYCLWAACPCLSWSTVAMRALTSFLGLPSHWRCALAVALHWRDSGLDLSHAQNYPWTFSLHAHLKFMVYGRKQTDIHRHNFRKCSHASVGLAQAGPNEYWGECYSYTYYTNIESHISFIYMAFPMNQNRE